MWPDLSTNDKIVWHLRWLLCICSHSVEIQTALWQVQKVCRRRLWYPLSFLIDLFGLSSCCSVSMVWSWNNCRCETNIFYVNLFSYGESSFLGITIGSIWAVSSRPVVRITWGCTIPSEFKIGCVHKFQWCSCCAVLLELCGTRDIFLFPTNAVLSIAEASWFPVYKSCRRYVSMLGCIPTITLLSLVSY